MIGDPVERETEHQCAGAARPAERFFRNGQPFAGTKNYRVELSNGRASVPTVLAASGSPADLPLSAGCRLLLDPSAGFATVQHSLSNIAGRSALTLLIPSHIHGASVYWQFAQLDQGILTTSNALRTLVY